ncbi:choice-of-anchor D domain-containing protein [Verrucomicrobiaceae bacterium 227]
MNSVFPVLILSLLAATFSFGQNIRVEGRRNANPVDPWATIDDGGNNPPLASQDATRFGNVTLGETRDERFRIKNTDGNTPLAIESVLSVGSEYTFPDLPGGGQSSFNVPSGGEREFIIRFRPTDFSLTGPLIQVKSNSKGASETFYTFRVSGTGSGPDMEVFGGSSFTSEIYDGDTSPRLADGTLLGAFNIDTEDPVERSFRIRNIGGNSGLNLSNPRFEGTGRNDFSFSGLNPAFNIGDGNTRDFTIRFDPTRAGTSEATFLVDTNDRRPGKGTFSFLVRAIATGTPVLTMEGRSFGAFRTYREITDGATSTASNNGTDAGVVELGETAYFTLRASNSGSDAISFDSSELSNPDFTSPSIVRGVIAGGSEVFSVSATPTTEGVHSSTVTLTSGDLPGGTFTFTLRVEVNDSGEEIEIRGSDQTSVIANGSEETNLNDGTDFGVMRRSVTSKREKEFTIFNVGSSALGISNPRITGAGAAAFSVSSLSTGTNISAGSDRSFKIIFEPSSDGEYFAEFSLDTSDANRDPYHFALKGIAAETPVLVVEAIDGDTGEWVSLANNQDAALYLGTAFPSFPWNEFRESPLRLRNTGFGDLNLQVNQSSKLFLVGRPAVIPQGGQVEINLRAEPQSPSSGNIDETISISANDPAAQPFRLKARIFSPLTASLKVVSSLRELDPLVDGQTEVSLEKGTIITDDPDSNSASRNFILRSQNDANFNLTSISLVGPEASFFHISGTVPGEEVPVNLRDDLTFTLPVFFDAPEFSRKEAFVLIKTDLPGNASDFTFRIEGRGQLPSATPRIEIVANDRVLEIGANPSVPLGNDFGAVEAGGPPESLTFKIRNSGIGSSLEITGASLRQEDDRVTFSGVPETILSDEEASFTLTLDPGLAPGVQSFSLVITSNDPVDPEYKLLGQYRVRPAGSPAIEVEGFEREEEGDLRLKIIARRDITMRLQASKTMAPDSWTDLGPVYSGLNIFPGVSNSGTFPKRFFQVVEE